MTKAELVSKLESVSACLAEAEGRIAEMQKPAQIEIGGVIGQIKNAIGVSYIATIAGALFGGFVPVAIWWLVHEDLAGNIWKPQLLLVLGGLAFSAKTVYQWCLLAFGCRYKAVGFTLLCEGVLTFAETPWLSLTALAYLVVMNAVATAATIAKRKE